MCFLLDCSISQAQSTAVLQSLIDQANSGDIVVPSPGVYLGPISIDKPITLDGQGQVTIDGGGIGSVVTLVGDGISIQGLHIKNSGAQHNDVDSGVKVKGNYNVIKDNQIDDCLFGVDLSQSNNNLVKHNTITSKNFEMGLRGDSVRLWYSYDNKVFDNVIIDARDFVVWYSNDNIFSGNDISGGRYGIHFMYSLYNLVENNNIHHNSVGIFLMYSDGVVIRNNTISHSIGATGMGIGFKEASDVTVEGNTIFYCGRGLYLDVSPLQPDTFNRIYSNRIEFTTMGIVFHNDWVGNKLKNNLFRDNFIQVSVNTRATVNRNEWDGNYWDDYQGFDMNQDGIGDQPYESRMYSEQLVVDLPYTSFFRGSPILSLIDFLERLLPFSDPILLLRDNTPLVAVDNLGATHSGQKDNLEMKHREVLDPFGLKS